MSSGNNGEITRYQPIRQSAVTNTLSRVTTGKRCDLKVDLLADRATVKKDALTVNLLEYGKYRAELKPSTHRLLDALVMQFTKQGGISRHVAMPMREYAMLCGLSDVKGAREQVERDLEALYRVSLSFKGRGRNFMDCRLCSEKGIVKGVIKFSFTELFFEKLKAYTIMPLPEQYFRLNGNANPNSGFFLRKLAEHKNMNCNKPNADLISVRALLDSSPMLPQYEEVASGGRQVRQRIIAPFERDMNALSDTLTWQYRRAGGGELTEAERSDLGYDEFTLLQVMIDWKQYPKRENKQPQNKRPKIALPRAGKVGGSSEQKGG